MDVVREAPVGREPDRLACFGRRVLPTLLLHEREGEHRVRLGRIGVGGRGEPEFPFGRGKALLLVEQVAALQVHVHFRPPSMPRYFRMSS